MTFFENAGELFFQNFVVDVFEEFFQVEFQKPLVPRGKKPSAVERGERAFADAAGKTVGNLGGIETLVAGTHQGVVQHLLSESGGADLAFFRLKNFEISVLAYLDLPTADLLAEAQQIDFQVFLKVEDGGSVPLAFGGFPDGEFEVFGLDDFIQQLRGSFHRQVRRENGDRIFQFSCRRCLGQFSFWAA